MKIFRYILVSAFLGIIIATYIWYISRLPTGLEMYIFDTKGKPSIFIRTPDDFRLLINGGANSEIIRRLTSVLPFYSRRIDEVILTNDDGNNASGLIDVINRYKVGEILVPIITSKKMGLASSTDQIYETFMDAVHTLHIPVKEVGGGDELVFSKENQPLSNLKLSNQLKAEILFPLSTSSNEFTYSKASAPEMVMRITYGDTSFLLLGNVSTKIQKFISTGTAMSDVLVISHSSSAGSLATDLIDQIKPTFIIYSAAITGQSGKSTKNKKLDPLYMILDDHRFNLKQKNTIEVLSDGTSVEVI